MGPDPNTMCSTPRRASWGQRGAQHRQGLGVTGALREPLWLCSYPLTSHWRDGHTLAGGAMGLTDPQGQSILGCPSADAAPEQPAPSGTALIPTPLHILAQRLAHAGSCTCRTPCTEGFSPHTEKRLHTHPAPAGSHTHPALHLDGLLHLPQEGNDTCKLT